MPMEQPRHLFVAPDAEPRLNWREAFSNIFLCGRISAAPEADMVWVLLPEQGDIAKLLA